MEQPHATPTDDVAGTVSCEELALLPDDELLAAGAAIEVEGRAVDAKRIAFAAEVEERSRAQHGDVGLANKKGCRTAEELLQRVCRVSGATARRRLKLGSDTRSRISLTGEAIVARYPFVAEALSAGELGVDAAIAIVKGLDPALPHASIDGMIAAETELVASATGHSPDTPVASSADEIALQASLWRVAIDPDGVEPSEERRMASRGFSRGTLRDGMVRGTYALMPEIGAKMAALFNAYLTPKTAPAFLSDEERAAADGAKDPRTADQQRHDIFAAMLDAMARSGKTPTVGGAAPTVLVSVRAEDLASGSGAGYIDGMDEPVSIHTVRQLTCAGGMQKIILAPDGQVIALGSPERCFTPAQRRAIMLRDGGCMATGCLVPASWTEIHHVIPDAEGGPTEVSNGVCLCWYHHRMLEQSGWKIRMVNGVPEIKAPPWIQPDAPWRRATKSRTRLMDGLEKRLE